MNRFGEFLSNKAEYCFDVMSCSLLDKLYPRWISSMGILFPLDLQGNFGSVLDLLKSDLEKVDKG